MLKIEKVDGTLPSFQPQDLEAAADQLPVRDDLLLMPTLVFIMPFTHQHIRTIAIDAEVGPYATTQSTKAISRNLGARISLFRIQVNETRRLVHAQMGLHGHPQRIIPYFATFFFPLSSNKKNVTQSGSPATTCKISPSSGHTSFGRSSKPRARAVSR
ncbi:hypothetical protein [Lacticaseibacillus camelliae]|uniref:hypothetical protein n=1 Tax=Lacticaseibacillus camelliae TaxID=381742 RepID=UPI0006D080E8|nr:hypothetical protein [Lacticaseibacillus camelliae]